MQKIREPADIYIASDGTRFFDERACKSHEIYLESKVRPVYKYSVCLKNPDGASVELFNITSQDDFDFVLRVMKINKRICLNYDDFAEYGAGWYMFRHRRVEFLPHYIQRRVKEIQDFENVVAIEAEKVKREVDGYESRKAND